MQVGPARLTLSAPLFREAPVRWFHIFFWPLFAIAAVLGGLWYWRKRSSTASAATPAQPTTPSLPATTPATAPTPGSSPAEVIANAAAAAKSALGTASQVVSNATNTAQQVQSGVAAADSFLGSLGIDTSSFVTGSFLN